MVAENKVSTDGGGRMPSTIDSGAMFDRHLKNAGGDQGNPSVIDHFEDGATTLIGGLWDSLTELAGQVGSTVRLSYDFSPLSYGIDVAKHSMEQQSGESITLPSLVPNLERGRQDMMGVKASVTKVADKAEATLSKAGEALWNSVPVTIRHRDAATGLVRVPDWAPDAAKGAAALKELNAGAKIAAGTVAQPYTDALADHRYGAVAAFGILDFGAPKGLMGRLAKVIGRGNEAVDASRTLDKIESEKIETKVPNPAPMQRRANVTLNSNGIELNGTLMSDDFGKRIHAVSFNKTLYKMNNTEGSYVIAVSKDSKSLQDNPDAIRWQFNHEVEMLNELASYDLPVVKATLGHSTHHPQYPGVETPAIVMEEVPSPYSSKDGLHVNDFQPNSIADLRRIADGIEKNGIAIDDFQFLLDGGGGIHINDPLRILHKGDPTLKPGEFEGQQKANLSFVKNLIRKLEREYGIKS